ncbi:MAG: helix-turn-helix transcriptional regulator [Candidatus Methanomethylophilaceae archaeon]|nr:helix-turn-helix transcriptional regulator [Candidatus Methanomethylophilaceae archaeon]
MGRSISIDYLFDMPSLDERMKGLAKRLQAYRKKMSLTQVQLAERFGVSYGSIKRFERSGDISLWGLWQICTVLECSDQLDSLFTKRKLTAEDIRNGR